MRRLSEKYGRMTTILPSGKRFYHPGKPSTFVPTVQKVMGSVISSEKQPPRLKDPGNYP
jgi:hypothetical protein